MADSNITKRALASSLKTLMSQYPFAKISIGDICERCEMNRKSFYYHFRDKYDLVNWIFDREFVVGIRSKKYNSQWEIFNELCVYLYDNKAFYRNAFEVQGQNSFSEYFLNFTQNLFDNEFNSVSDNKTLAEFNSFLMSQATKSILQAWLISKDCIKPDEFSSKVKASVQSIAFYITDNKN